MIHENVEKIREAKGVSKTHLARKLGLSLQGYKYAASSDSRLDVERINILAKCLGVSVEVFFDNELTKNVISKLEKNESYMIDPDPAA